MHGAVPAEFDEACVALETILREIVEYDDSYSRDSGFKEVVFKKYPELETLHKYLIPSNDKAYTKYMFSELKHQVINFLVITREGILGLRSRLARSGPGGPAQPLQASRLHPHAAGCAASC